MHLSGVSRYEVGVRLPGEPCECSLKLCFVTAVSGDAVEVMSSLTMLMKDLGQIKSSLERTSSRHLDEATEKKTFIEH